MGRPPEVFVRPVTMTEGQRLKRIGHAARDPVKLRQAIVVMMSAQGGASRTSRSCWTAPRSTCGG
jgi:hypothetical protein